MTPSTIMFDRLEWLSVPKRLMYNKAVLTYKALNNLAPAYISGLLKPVSETHTRSLNLKMDFSPYLDYVLRYLTALSHTLPQNCGAHYHSQSELNPQGGTLIFSLIRRLGPFFWVQNSEFQYFFGFSEKLIFFGGTKILWIIFWGHHKIGLV